MESGTTREPLPDRVREALRWYGGTWRVNAEAVAGILLWGLLVLVPEFAGAPLHRWHAEGVPWQVGAVAAALYLAWLRFFVRPTYREARAEVGVRRAGTLAVLNVLLPPVLLSVPPGDPALLLWIGAVIPVSAALRLRFARRNAVGLIGATLLAAGSIWLGLHRGARWPWGSP